MRYCYCGGELKAVATPIRRVTRYRCDCCGEESSDYLNDKEVKTKGIEEFLQYLEAKRKYKEELEDE